MFQSEHKSVLLAYMQIFVRLQLVLLQVELLVKCCLPLQRIFVYHFVLERLLMGRQGHLHVGVCRHSGRQNPYKSL